jgi:hypothetical protein
MLRMEIQVFDSADAHTRAVEAENNRLHKALALLVEELDADSKKSMVSDASRHARWWRHRVRELFGR